MMTVFNYLQSCHKEGGEKKQTVLSYHRRKAGHKALGLNCNKAELNSFSKKVLMVRTAEHGTRCPGKLWHLPHCRFSRRVWSGTFLGWSRNIRSCLCAGDQTGQPLKYLPSLQCYDLSRCHWNGEKLLDPHSLMTPFALICRFPPLGGAEGNALEQ